MSVRTSFRKVTRSPNHSETRANWLKRPAVEPLEARIAPAALLSATKVDVFAPGGDVNGDGNFDPGDTILYTVTITNAGDVDLTGVTFQDLIDGNTTLGAINASPLARNDLYTAQANTQLVVGSPTALSGLFTSSSTNPLANDSEFFGDSGVNTILTSFQSTSAQGGSVGMVTTGGNAGSFSYVSAPGFTGVDTFTYTLRDDGFDGIAGNSDDLSSVGTISISVVGTNNSNATNGPVVWYVDSVYAGANGASNGTSARPFTTLTPLNNAGVDPDDAGDTIYLFESGAVYTAGITLEGSQRIIGEGTALVVNTLTLNAAGTAPTISLGAGTAITLGSGNTLTGFTIGNSQRDILGLNFGTLTVSNVTLNGTGKTLDLETGSFASGSAFLSVTSTGTSGLTTNGHGMRLVGVGGSVAFGSTSISGTEAQAVFVFGSTADINFGNTTIGTGAANSGGTEGLRLEANPSGTYTFGTLSIQNVNGRGFSLFGNGAPALAAANATVTGTTTISTTSSDAVLVQNTVGTASLQALNISNVTGTGGGIVLTNHNAAFSATSGTIGTVAGTDVSITGGTGAVTIPQAITNTAGGFMVIDNHETGNVTFSGNLSSTNAAGGISVQNVNSGTITFSGATKTLSTSTGSAINLATNGGGTINFTGGGLVITTSSGTGFSATGGGTVSVTGTGNTINSTSGATALNIQNTNIGAGNVTFQSISSTGGSATGIILDTTGSAGGLRVTGTGAAGSGGTIANKTGGEGAFTTGNGIYLNATTSVRLASLQLNDFQNSAIRGFAVNGFTLEDSVISGTIGTSTGEIEGAIAFGHVGPAFQNGLTGNSLIDNVNISGSVEHHVEVYNQSGTMHLTISNSNIHDNSVAGGSDGIQMEFRGTAQGFINIDGNSFSNNKSQAIQISALETSNIHATISSNTVTRGTQGNEGIVLSNGGDSDLRVLIGGPNAGDGNTISGFGGVAIFVGQVGGQGSAASLLEATIQGNTVTSPASATNHAILAFVSSVTGAVSEARFRIDNNVVNYGSAAGRAILVDAPDTGRTPNFHATVTNNVVTASDINAVTMISVAARNGATGRSDIRGNDVNFTGGSTAVGINVRESTLGTNVLARGASASNDAATVLAANNPLSATGVLPTSADIPVVENNTISLPATPTLPTLPLFFAPAAEDSASGELPPVELLSVVTPPVDGGATLPLTVPTPPALVDDGILSQGELDTLVAAAIARWEATGLTPAQSALLHNVTFSVSDLSGWYLGQASGSNITLDADAAGNAWFVDTTPLDDSEFVNGQATANGGAFGRVDALTTITHELGHVLGLSDNYSSAQSDSLMYGFIGQGERRVATAGLASGVAAHGEEHDGVEYINSTLTIGDLGIGKSVTVQFRATISPTITVNSVSNQGTVDSDQTAAQLTDDPSVGGAADATVTPVDLPDVNVTVAPPAVAEDGSGTLTYTFTREGLGTNALTVNFNVGGTTALTGDFTLASGTGTVAYTAGASTGTLTFAAGSTTATLIMSPTDDTVVEPNETVILTVATGTTGYEVGTTPSATGTMNNDDTDVSVAVAPTSVTEDGASTLVYTFTRAGVTTGALTANFSSSGTATFLGGDFTVSHGGSIGYNASSGAGTVTFDPGVTTVTITFDPVADNVVESDETVILTVGAATGGNIYNAAGSPAQGTLSNDDSTVTIAVAPTSVAEDGAANLIYTFTRTGFTTNALTVNLNVTGTAALTGDYSQDFATFSTTTGAATVTFAAGSATATVTINPTADATGEPDETVILTLAANGAPIATGGYTTGTPSAATGTISNDDTAVTVAVAPASVSEASGTLVYSFTRTGDTSTALLVSFTAGGAAVFGAAADYTQSGADTFTAAGGTITLPIGQASATITFTPVNDTVVETDETAVLTVVTGPGYVAGATPVATGTITNDDTDVTVAVAPASVTEDGATNLIYTFTRTGVTSDAKQVNFTVTGTASLPDGDYSVSASNIFSLGTFTGLGTIVFPAGSSTVTFTVNPSSDATVEGDETAIVTLTSGPGYNVATPSGATGTITNDDSDETLAIAPGSVTEDGASNLAYTFTRNGFVGNALTVNFNVAGSATFNTDYTQSGAANFTAASGTVSFLAGATTATVTIDPSADTTVEGDETTLLTLASGSGYNVATAGAVTGTITNDDTDVSVAVSPASVTEDGAGNLVYTFTRNGVTATALTVNFSVGGSATFAADYAQSGAATFTTTTGTVTFAAGSATAVVTLDPTTDLVVEANESATLTVTAGSGYTAVAPTAATGTITNDDTDISVAVSPGSVFEDGAGNLVYTFLRSGVTSGALTVDFSVGGGATFGTDYGQSGAATFATTTGTVAFAPGATTATVTIDPTVDGTVEPDETAVLTVVTGPGYNAAGTAATGTILNDDASITVAVSPASVVEDGVANLVYTFTRAGFTTNALTVNVNVTGTASFTGDYGQNFATFNTGTGAATVSFLAGSNTATVTIDPTADALGEANESVILSLAVGSGYSLGTPDNATGTIVNDDTAVSVVVVPASATEAAGTLVYTFTRTGDTSTALLVDFNVDGTATFTDDYTQAGAASFGAGVGTITIPIGQASATVTLTSTNDTVVEGAENAQLTVVAGAGYAIGGAPSASGTIDDNDSAVIRLTSGTSTVGEGAVSTNLGVELVITGNGTIGTGTLGRTVSLDLAALATGTATSGADFSFSSPQTVSFGIGQGSTITNVAVGITNDAAVEGDETVNFQLNALVDNTGNRVSLAGTTAHTLTIDDNDTATLGFAASSSTVNENGVPQVAVALTITANGVGTPTLERPVTFTVGTTGGTATAGGVDYSIPNPLSVTFAAGATSSSQMLAVTLINDTVVEGLETIALGAGSLTDGTNGQVSQTGPSVHGVSITDNDTATIQFTTDANTTGEGTGTNNLSVMLQITGNGEVGNGTLGQNVSVNVGATGGSATGAGSDYTFTNPTTVTFAAGAVSGSQSVALGLVNDDRVEGTETAAFGLSALTGPAGQVSLGARTAHTLTITDNDTATVSLVSNASIAGEADGTHNLGVALVITANGVANTGTLDRSVSVNLQDLLSGSASSGGVDYSFGNPQTITFASGESSSTKNASITIENDTKLEGSETINFQANTFTDGTAGQVTFTGSSARLVTITDNESATIALAAGTASVNETAGTLPVGVTLVITANGVANTGTLDRAVSVTLTDLLSGSATPGGFDYAITSPQTLTFGVGESSSTKTANLTVTDDGLSEGNETLNLQLGGLSDPSERVSLGAQTTEQVTIVDNDIDLTLTKTESANVVVAGSGAGNLTYTITVTNGGLTNATGIVISEDLTLPSGVTLVSATPSSGAFASTIAPDGTWTIDTLAVGASATLTVVLTVGASTAEGTDLISNTAAVTGTNESRSLTGDDSDTESTSVDRQVDLQITKTDGVNSAAPGSTLSYAISYGNNGPSDATGVVITETLPAGTTFNAAGSVGTWTETSPGIFTLTVGTLAGAASGTATFAVTVNNPAAAGLDEIANTASIADDTTAGADVNGGNNTAGDTDTVEAAPDLQISITDDPLVAKRGGPVAYTVSYVNLGLQDATGVFITMTLPANSTFDPFNSTGIWADLGGGVYRYEAGNVAVGEPAESAVFAVRVNATLPGNFTALSTTGTIADDAANGAELNTANNSDTETTPLYQGIYAVSPGVTFPRSEPPPVVRVFDIATGVQIHSITAYEGYRDSIRVAVGDINGDGFDDLITSTRKGSGSVRVFDGVTGERFTGAFAEIAAFPEAGARGAFVAAGDVNGDNRDDIIVGSGQGARGGGKVKVFDGVTGTLLSNAEPFGSKFRGGVRVAAGDVNGDGVADIITSQGYGGNDVRVTSGLTSTVLHNFEVGGAKYRGGVFVSAANLDSDGRADLIVGTDRGTTIVETYNGATGALTSAFLPFAPNYRLGARVAAADVNLDGVVDIIVGAGGKGNSQVKIFNGLDRSLLSSFQAFPAFAKGALFVAGTSPVPSVAPRGDSIPT